MFGEERVGVDEVAVSEFDKAGRAVVLSVAWVERDCTVDRVAGLLRAGPRRGTRRTGHDGTMGRSVRA